MSTRRAMGAVLVVWLGLAASARAEEPAPEPWRQAVESARAEAERARVEADRARAEADRARAEADRARAEADRAIAELARWREEGPVVVPMVPVEPVVRGPRPGDFAHDGMFLRLTAGVGYAGYQAHGTTPSPNQPANVIDPSDHGMSGGFALSLGASVRPNLALHGTIAFLSDTPSSGDRVFLEGSNVLVGGGVTWYAMPWNLYLTGGAALATFGFVIHDRRAGYEERDDSPRWAYGPGVFASIGKEWWTGPAWSLGLALEGTYARTYGDDLTFDHAGGQLVFSATFN